MKTYDNYRFSLQWGTETEEKVMAGDFLESLGNRKSSLVVKAVNEYLAAHPEVLVPERKSKTVLHPGYTQPQVEKMIAAALEKKQSGSDATQKPVDMHPNEPSADAEDVDEMLKNLDVFK
jgi:hypothetical protein